MEKIYTVQSARFIAALLVIVDHSVHYTHVKLGGFDVLERFFTQLGGMSVAMFFAISGFVISASAQKVNAVQFFTARMLRIYSGFFLAVAITLSVKSYLFGPSQFATWQSLTLLPFGKGPYPLFIEWSLVFEVFFYLLFTCVWVFRSNAVLRACLIAWLCAILIGGHFHLDDASPLLPNYTQIIFSYYNLAFIFGALFYQFRQQVNSIEPTLLLLAALALGVVGPVLTDSGHIALGTEAACAVTLLSFLYLTDRPDSRLASFSRLGDYSYGMYLMHATIVTVGLSISDTQSAPSYAVLIAIILLSFGGSTLFGAIDNIVHRTIRRTLRRFFDQRKAQPSNENQMLVAPR